ncbi:hypothetical protein NDU88_011172 [Pleurodeles waltl]|uniref:Uncharacterized protein n=1 Tax=Pleurodeles waltl TaxID=8319 RepID=A0AAV7QXV2_PLEWA|nr:hypothetical protein NDU88_011172 [Pleurodeles waltl]
MSRKRGAKEHDIHVGDVVLVKCRRGGSKFVLPFEKDPWVVSDVKGTLITAKRGPESITKNILLFKKIHTSDFQVPIDTSSSVFDPGSITDQETDDVASQSPCLVTNGASSSELMSSDVQSPDSHLVWNLALIDLCPWALICRTLTIAWFRNLLYIDRAGWLGYVKLWGWSV